MLYECGVASVHTFIHLEAEDLAHQRCFERGYTSSVVAHSNKIKYHQRNIQIPYLVEYLLILCGTCFVLYTFHKLLLTVLMKF